MSAKKRHAPPTRVIDAILAKDVSKFNSAIRAGDDVNERDADGRTALHHAVLERDLALVNAVLRMNALVTVADITGWTPLHFAAQSHDEAIMQVLVDAGASIDVEDEHGNTPLFRAVFESRGRGQAIELLLKNGANKHHKNRHGTSPFDLANNIANFDVKKWLHD